MSGTWRPLSLFEEIDYERVKLFLRLLFILSFFVFCNKNNVVKITNLIRNFEAVLNFSRDLNLSFTVFTLPKI